MALLRVFGNFTDDPLDLAFNFTGDPIIDLVSSTEIRLGNPVNGIRAVFTGTNLALNINAEPPTGSGTLTGFAIRTGDGQPLVQLTTINWNFSQFLNALFLSLDANDDSGLNALLSLQPVTFDASARTGSTEYDFFGVTSSVTMTGSNFADTLEGGHGNDTIRPGAGGPEAYDLIDGSRGNDRIELTGAPATSFIEVNYRYLDGAVVAAVNSAANTASVTKGAFGTDTIIGVRDVIRGEGLVLTGSRFNDTFNLASTEGFTGFAGGGGNDTFNLTLAGGGVARVYYNFGAGTGQPVGIIANLTTGLVSRDGFGGQDQINITGTNGRFELEGTDFADSITGSTRNERFILRGGNDTLDGGGGVDLVRYDRAGNSTGVTVDLQAGTATGLWSGLAFTHRLSNIEEVRGSTGNDELYAATTGSLLEGQDGNDSLYGSTGSDELYGGAGNDYLDPVGNADFDVIEAGSGTDIVDFTGAVNGWFQLEHWSLLTQTAINVTINSLTNTSTVAKGAFGQTTLVDVRAALRAEGLAVLGTNLGDNFNVTTSLNETLQLMGGRGADTYTVGGFGVVELAFDRDGDGLNATQGLVANFATGLVSNDGFGFQDSVTAATTVKLQIRGTQLADNITGSARDDFFLSLAGNDTINGGAGFDTISYDRNEAGAMQIDLAAGRAHGSFNGQAFTDTFSGIEGATGSRFGNDWIKGSAEVNILSGRGGNDALFGDGYRAVYDLDDARAVYRIYQATLDRAPDTAGQLFWTERLATDANTLTQVATSFVGSTEFQNVYGTLSNTAFVTLLYSNVLNRAADTGGLTFWTNALASGTSRAQVVLGFSESSEFRTSTNTAATQFTQERNPTIWQDDVFRLYQATLDRNPDIGGFKSWLTNLGNGTPFLNTVASFVNSAEFQTTYGTLSNSAFVTLLYNNVLNRAPDAGGLTFWSNALAGGQSRAQVVQGFSQSGEFITATAPALETWIRAQGRDDVLEGNAGSNDLWGGIMADVFTFERTEAGTHRVHDLEAWDYLDFNDFGYTTGADVRAHMTQQGANVVFADQGTTITLLNTQLAALDNDTFIF